MTNVNKNLTIVIIGDSWGVPNYPPVTYINNRINEIKKLSNNVEIKFQHLGDPPETHLEFLLRDAGHTVVNLSKSGGSNLEAIEAVKKYTESNEVNIDWLIWFHTESLRDRDAVLTSKKIKFNISKLSRDLATIAYNKFSELIKNLKCKVVVVGGQAPVYLDEFNSIVGDVNLLIDDWHSEIHGIKLPFTHALCNLDIFELSSCVDSVEEKNKMLDDIDFILKLDYESENFPDNAHPGKHAHRELFKKINNLIS